MGITIAQPGASKLAAAAGTATGQAARAKEDRAKADRKRAEDLRLVQQQMADKARQRAQETAMEWEMQKMQINSQRSFERELRQEDYKLMAEDRAAERSIERMETAKDLEFQYETQERQRKVGEFDNQITALNKAADDKMVDRDFAWQDKMTQLVAGRDAAKTGIPYREPSTGVAEQQAANRESRAQEAHEARMTRDPRQWFYQTEYIDTPEGIAAKTRYEQGVPKTPADAKAEARAEGRYQMAQKAHEASMAGRRAAVPTDEKLRRERVDTVMGSAYREVPLEEAEAEMRELGLMPEQGAGGDPNNITVRELDITTAQVILQEAGGNRDRARQIATSRGYKF